MKKIIITIPLLASLLSGCIFSGNQSDILIGKDGQVIAGRNQNDGYVGGKEADAKALSAMAEAIDSDTVTVVNTIDENGNPKTTTTIRLGGLILASKIDQVQSIMAQTSVPKTAFAQGMEATGNAVSKNGTLFMGLGASWIWKETIGEIVPFIGDNNSNYVYRDIDGSFNETKVIGKGTATGPAMGGDTIMGPAPLGVE